MAKKRSAGILKKGKAAKKVTKGQKAKAKGFKDRTPGQKLDVKKAMRGARAQVANLAEFQTAEN